MTRSDKTYKDMASCDKILRSLGIILTVSTKKSFLQKASDTVNKLSLRHLVKERITFKKPF